MHAATVASIDPRQPQTQPHYYLEPKPAPRPIADAAAIRKRVKVAADAFGCQMEVRVAQSLRSMLPPPVDNYFDHMQRKARWPVTVDEMDAIWDVVDWLAMLSTRALLAVWLRNAVGLSWRRAGKVLDVSHMTVKSYERDAVNAILAQLRG